MQKQLTLKVCYKDMTRRIKRNLVTIEDVHDLGELVEPGIGKQLLYSYVDIDRDEIDLISQDDVDTLVSDLAELMQGVTALKIYVRNVGEPRKWADKYLRKAWVWNPYTCQREKYASKSIGQRKPKSMSRKLKFHDPVKSLESDQNPIQSGECLITNICKIIRDKRHRGHKHQENPDCAKREEPRGRLMGLKMARMPFEERKALILKKAEDEKIKLEKELAEALTEIDKEYQKQSKPLVISFNSKREQSKALRSEIAVLDADGMILKYGKRVVWSEVVRRTEYLMQFFPNQAVERLEKLSIKYVDRQPSDLIPLYNAFLERVGEKTRAKLSN